jgi:tetratricopeptide (TPR) repeat protein
MEPYAYHRRWLFAMLLLAPFLAGAEEKREPLFDTLGDYSYRITTDSALAQRYFDQGLRWTYAFNHAAARRAFREAQRRDPHCAMCYWGEALVLGPNINAAMEPATAPKARPAVEAALAVAGRASEHEQALIGALVIRYQAHRPRAALDRAYAQAMGQVHARFPKDHDIAVLYADAIMNTRPWDYWEADGRTPKAGVAKAIRTVEQVLAENPDHVGAIHLYIHLTEASATPERAEPYADRLARLMPGAGHIVHMGAHTYTQVGRFRDTVALNKRAVAADEAYFAMVEDHSLWRYGYHPHNIHYVVMGAFMVGDAATALDYAQRLQGTIPDEVAAGIGWIQAIRQAPYFVYAHLADPRATLALEDPGDRFPFVKAMWHYARGVAYAQLAEPEKAAAEAAAIDALAARDHVSYPADIAPAVKEVLRIASRVVRGRIAQCRGEWDAAVTQFEAAAQLQDELPYLEPPLWYYPIRQSLGAALMQAGKPREAERVFRQSLKEVPGNGWALFGLLQTQKALGESSAAMRTAKRFEGIWVGPPPDLGRL